MNDLSIPKLKTVADYEYVLVDNTQLYIYTSASKSDYCSYLTRLSDFGAKNIFSNQIGNNLFNTYIYGDRLIHAYYYEGSDEVRVVLEKKCGNINIDYSKYDIICNPTLTVMSLMYSPTELQFASGMSYIIRLEDGSFVIYDGGYENDADRLFSYLKHHTPYENGRIVVSAWIFTHSHKDHYSCFKKFSETYCEFVGVKNFVLNTPPMDETVIIPERHDTFLSDEFPNLAKKYHNANIIRAHTGYKLKLFGAEIEVLQTFEDILPRKMEWLNEGSLVTRMNIAGQTIMFPADCEFSGCSALEKYQDYLKSDFMQIIHHGYSGGTVQLMDYIDPKYVMWPTSFESYTRRIMSTWSKKQANNYLMIKKNVEYSFVADGACKILSLPFKNDKDIELYEYED